MLRTPITLTAAALAAALALTACGTVRLGSAAVTDTSRIPTATVSAEVSNLDAAYKAGKAKVQLQFPPSQMPQQVLSWLVRFRVREEMAARNHLTITRAEIQSALASASAQAKQSGVTLTDLAVANGIPPDQISDLGRYEAIQNQLLDRLDGGTLPTASAALQTLGTRFNTVPVPGGQEHGHPGQPAVRGAGLQPGVGGPGADQARGGPAQRIAQPQRVPDAQPAADAGLLRRPERSQ